MSVLVPTACRYLPSFTIAVGTVSSGPNNEATISTLISDVVILGPGTSPGLTAVPDDFVNSVLPMNCSF